jgi:hypothetical protein
MTTKKNVPPDPATTHQPSEPPSPPPVDTIPLKDLAPRRDVSGGRGKLLFGEQAVDGWNRTREP